MTESSGRSHLPWVVAALVLVVGGAKVDAARPLLARALAVGAPVIPVLIGLGRLQGARAPLERAGNLLGWLTIVAAEICIARGFFGVAALDSVAPFAKAALFVAAACAVTIELLDRRQGGKSRLGAYLAMSVGFASYLPTHAGKDQFFAVFAAFFSALFWGAAGLLLGELLARSLGFVKR